MKNKNFFIIFCFVLFFVFIFIYFSKENNLSGKIIYRKLYNLNEAYNENNHNDYIYMIHDFENNYIQDIGLLRGVPSISRNGDMLAVSCYNDKNSICILDLLDYLDLSEFPRSQYSQLSPHEIKRILLPDQCSQNINSRFGLESISWSPNDQKLVIVCGYYPREYVDYELLGSEREICIIDLKTEKTDCWKDNEILIARWSPKEDKLLLSTKGLKEPKIYIYYLDNKTKEFLVEGFGADWAPNGKEIAFFSDETINILNLENKKQKILYENLFPKESDYGYVLFFNDVSYLIWGPNGDELIFESSYIGINNNQVFIINVKNSEITCLSCFDIECKYSFNPTWGK